MSTQVMSTKPFVDEEVSTGDPPCETDSEDIERDNDDEVVKTEKKLFPLFMIQFHQ